MSKTKLKPQIVPSQIGISSILKTYWLRVPPHQREYRWAEKHVERLFEDLQQALNSDQPQYFLGTIVTIPDENGVLEIIDGQQRLATVTILLSALRRYLEPIEADLANKSLPPFLTEYDRSQKMDVPKLKLNLLDNDFFGKMLSTAPPYTDLAASAPLSHKRIKNAFVAAHEYVLKIVAPSNKKDHGDVLSKWIDFLEEDADVILFRVPTGANAYKMFETLNDRGLRTTQADLVKSYLFSKAADRYEEAQASWSMMTGALASLQGESTDQDGEKEDLTVIFLRAALMCKRGHLTRGEVYEVIQGLGKGPQTVITLLKDLEQLANVYEATFSQDNAKWKSCPDAMRNAIQTINDFDIKPFRPALLAIAAKFTDKEATLAFTWFASLGVRLLMTTGTRSGSVEATFSDLAQKVYAGEIKTAGEIKKLLSSFVPTNDEFQQGFQTATVSNASFARYYLRALEKAGRNEKQPWWVPNTDKESMTLEHILPQKPVGNWPQFTDEEVATYVRRIGNLCLLPKSVNSDLRSADQASKYAIYKDAPYALTSQIVTEPVWNVAAICKRQIGLAELALKAWPL